MKAYKLNCLEPNKKEIEQFYDGFKHHQQHLGVTLRHRKIARMLKAFGLKKTDAVLEVGCGIGTVSGLIIPNNKKGKFVGVDISAESIRLAQNSYKKYTHASFLVNDMSDFKTDVRFDWFVFPDVLEHIPVSNHPSIFKTLRLFSKPNAKILIHIPHPKRIAWLRTHQPEQLQIIDQELDVLNSIQMLHNEGFVLSYYQEYALHHKPYDYIFMMFRTETKDTAFKLKNVITRAWEHSLSKW